MHKSRENSLKRLLDVFSSAEVKSIFRLTDTDLKILNEFWVNEKRRNDLADEIGVSRKYLSKRYSKIITKIKNGLSELIDTKMALQQNNKQLIRKVGRLEEINRFFNGHFRECEYRTASDSIGKVNMSTRLYNRLIERGIIRLNDLESYTREELLQGRNFGKETLLELEKIMSKYNVSFKVE